MMRDDTCAIWSIDIRFWGSSYTGSFLGFWTLIRLARADANVRCSVIVVVLPSLRHPHGYGFFFWHPGLHSLLYERVQAGVSGRYWA